MHRRHSVCFAFDRFERIAYPRNRNTIANATDSDGTISQVQFYHNTTLLGTATKQGNTNSYLFNWNNVALGNYSITAIATDSQNISSTSTPISITVANATTQVYYIHTDQSA